MDIRSQIEATIEPWRTGTDRPPPFTCAELVVIALVLHERPLSHVYISFWVLRSFAFYERLGREAVWTYWSADLGNEQDVERFGPARASGLRRALCSYDVPVIAVDEEPGKDEEVTTETKWIVDPTKAMSYLCPRLWPQEKTNGTFPFLRLPSQLRNVVYDMVFAFPPSGVQINCHEVEGSGTVYAASRSFHQPFDFDLWITNAEVLATRRVSDLRSLLLVNRQIRSEALYVFPSINTFYFRNASHLRWGLLSLSAGFRDNIRHIAFNHRAKHLDATAICEAFQSLAGMPQLRTLKIRVDQEEVRRWFPYDRQNPPIVHTGFDLAPRIKDTVHVQLYGDCPMEIGEQIHSEPVAKPESLSSGD